jgi:hypothetical protein
LIRIYKKNPTQKSFKIKSFFGCPSSRAALRTKELLF